MAATRATTRAKFGYLNYADMLALLESDDSKKKLDAYDIVYGKDTKEQYLISPELKPIPIRSRVLCFDSTSDAYKELNADDATYNGQIIAVKIKDKYESYIVNTNTTGKFYVSPVSSSSDIDYNSLGNKPIENVVGTLDKPIVIEEFASGVYNVSGQYNISKSIETTFISTVPEMFFVTQADDSTIIKKICADEIVTYTVSNGEVSKTSVVTDDMLGDFATTEYVDAKIKALDFVLEDDIKAYINELLDTTIEELVVQKIEEVFDDALDERIDTRIDSKLTDSEISEESIEGLFV